MKRESPGPDDTDDSGGEGKLAVARQPSAETFYQHTACEPQRISPYETFPDQDEESCPDRPKGVASSLQDFTVLIDGGATSLGSFALEV